MRYKVGVTRAHFPRSILPKSNFSSNVLDLPLAYRTVGDSQQEYSDLGQNMDYVALFVGR